jgi:hypothetical protein
MCYIAGTLEIIINGQRAFHDTMAKRKSTKGQTMIYKTYI